MPRKLSIFDILKAVDLGDLGFPDRLDQEERAELDKATAYPLLRWMSATCGRDHGDVLEIVNEMANESYFGLSAHRWAQYALLSAIGTRTNVKRCWIAPPKGASSKDTAVEIVLESYPLFHPEDAKLWLEVNGVDGLRELCVDLGMQETETKTIVSKGTSS